MLRTILSENQYDPKFMMAANANAMTRPFEPPSQSPSASNTALMSPRSNAVLIPFAMVLS